MRDRQASGFRHALQMEGVNRQDAVWLLLMSVMMIVLLLPISSYVAALAFIKEEWGLNNTQSGIIYSAYLAGYAVSALFVIPLTDRLGPRNILMGSAAVSVAAHLVFPLVADSMVTGILLRIVAGVGLAGMYMPGARVVAERFSRRGRGTAVGLFVTAYYVASSGSLAITGVLMTSLEWQDAYLWAALASIAGLPMAYLLLRDQHDGPDSGSSGRLDLTVINNPPVRYLILGYSLHAMQLYAARVWLPLFLTAALVSRGVDSAQAAVTGATVGGVALIVGSVGPVAGGIMSDRWGRVTAASAIFALSGVCSWAIGWTIDLPWALIVAVAVIYGWAIAADSAVYTIGITEVANPVKMGSTLAVHTSLGYMTGVAGPIAFGGILDLSPEGIQWGVAYSAFGILSVVAILGIQRLPSMPQSRLLARGKG